MISRAKVYILAALLILSGFALLVCESADVSNLWKWICLGTMILSGFLFFLFAWRCPKCHRFGLRGPKVFSEDLGHCVYCGERIEFKK